VTGSIVNFGFRSYIYE